MPTDYQNISPQETIDFTQSAGQNPNKYKDFATQASQANVESAAADPMLYNLMQQNYAAKAQEGQQSMSDLYPGYQQSPVVSYGNQLGPTIASPGALFPWEVVNSKQRAKAKAEEAAKWKFAPATFTNPIDDSRWNKKFFETELGFWKDAMQRTGNSVSARQYLDYNPKFQDYMLEKKNLAALSNQAYGMATAALGATPKEGKIGDYYFGADQKTLAAELMSAADQLIDGDNIQQAMSQYATIANALVQQNSSIGVITAVKENIGNNITSTIRKAADMSTGQQNAYMQEKLTGPNGLLSYDVEAGTFVRDDKNWNEFASQMFTEGNLGQAYATEEQEAVAMGKFSENLWRALDIEKELDLLKVSKTDLGAQKALARFEKDLEDAGVTPVNADIRLQVSTYGSTSSGVVATQVYPLQNRVTGEVSPPYIYDNETGVAKKTKGKVNFTANEVFPLYAVITEEGDILKTDYPVWYAKGITFDIAPDGSAINYKENQIMPYNNVKIPIEQKNKYMKNYMNQPAN